MGAADSCSLRSDSYVRMQQFVRRTTSVPFRRFWGMCGENSFNLFMLRFMTLWVPLSATLRRRAVLMLWHAFLFLGLRFFSSFHIFTWWPPQLLLARTCGINRRGIRNTQRYNSSTSTPLQKSGQYFAPSHAKNVT
jgi:hypothetical protein